jgi:hypothetical protein
MLEAYIQQLAIDLEIDEEIKTEEFECYEIPIEEHITLTIRHHPPGFILFSSFAPLPQTPSEELLTTLMSANLLGRGTGNALLGLEPKGKTLTLSQVIPYQVNYHEFSDILEDFVNSVDFWYEQVIEFTKHGTLSINSE